MIAVAANRFVIVLYLVLSTSSAFSVFIDLSLFWLLCSVVSLLVFVFPDIIKYARNGELDLEYPEDFSIKESDFEQFRNESADLTKYNDGNGLSFYEIDVLIRHNRKALLKVFEKEALLPYLLKLIERIRKDISSNKHVEGDPMKKIFLTHHRSIQEEIGCVYCVVKDT